MLQAAIPSRRIIWRQRKTAASTDGRRKQEHGEYSETTGPGACVLAAAWWDDGEEHAAPRAHIQARPSPAGIDEDGRQRFESAEDMGSLTTN